MVTGRTAQSGMQNSRSHDIKRTGGIDSHD